MQDFGTWIGQMNRVLAAKFPNPRVGEILIGLTAILAILAIVWLVMRLVQKIFGATESKIRGIQGFAGFRLQEKEILSGETIVRVLATCVRWLGRLASLVVVLFGFEALLALEPGTRPLAGGILVHLLAALETVLAAMVGYLPELVTVLVVLAIARGLLRLIRVVFDGLHDEDIRLPGFYPEWARPTYAIVRLLLVAMTLVVVFPYLPGAESPAFRGVSIFMGVLISLGSSGTVANAFAGTVLTYTRAFHIGDRVEIGGTVGRVMEKTLFVTRLLTRHHEEVSIPNSMVLTHQIVNYSARAEKGGLLLHVSVTIGYDVPWRQVHRLLLDAARGTRHIEPDPAPFVLQRALSDFYVDYEVNASTQRVAELNRIYSELHQRIQDGFVEAGVEIASPHLRAVREGLVQLPPTEEADPEAEARGSITKD